MSDDLTTPRLQANAVRGQYLLACWEENLTVGDLLSVAAGSSPTALHLRRIPLVSLIESAKRLPRKRCYKMIEKILAICEVKWDKHLRYLTVGWLLDARSCTRRLAAFADVMDVTTPLTSPFFPFGRS